MSDWWWTWDNPWRWPRFLRHVDSIMCRYRWSLIAGPLILHGPIESMYKVK